MNFKLTFIDSFKGLLRMWIVLFHYTTRYFEIMNIPNDLEITWTNGARIGVPLFFVISGFLTEYSQLKKCNAISYRWLFARFLRLYPLYVFSVFIIFVILRFAAIDGLNVTNEDLLKNLILIPILGTKYIDGAHWYLFALLKFYIIYYIMKQLGNTRKKFNFLCLYVLIACIMAYYFNIRLLQVLTLSGALIFLFTGIVIAKMFFDKEDKFIKIIAYVFIIVSVPFCPYIWYVIYLSLFMFLIYMGESCIYHRGGQLLSSIGKISFAWYLIHQDIGYVVIYKLCNSYNFKTVFAILITIIFTSLMAIALTKVDLFVSSKIRSQI